MKTRLKLDIKLTPYESMKLIEMVTQWPNILWSYCITKNIEIQEDFEEMKKACSTIHKKLVIKE